MPSMICGREFVVTTPGPQGNVAPWRIVKRPYGRVLVDGINHLKGLPIRFKSYEKAERYIKERRLEK